MIGSRTLLIPILLLLPVAGLGYSWITTEIESREGTEWDVPIVGYDPRDLLRGHYVQYQYAWPGLVEEQNRFAPRFSGARICIRGQAPEITQTEKLDSREIDSERRAASCDTIVKYNPWSEEGTDGLNNDRLFLSQEKAAEYQKKLNDRNLQAVARIRVNSSNHIVPIDIRFRPRENAEPEGAPDSNEQ